MNEPWNDPFSIWKSRSAFFTWLRGQLRRSWTKYPLSRKFKDSQCRPNIAGGRARWVANCSDCGKEFAKSHLQVDHVIPCGSIRSWEDSAEFLERLFTTSDHMRLLCKPCHARVTMMDRFSLTARQADLKRLTVDFMKKDAAWQKQFLTRKGCKPGEIANARQRKQTYQNIIYDELGT